MRERVTRPKLERFMRELARNANVAGRVYLVGGASAVLFGWRDSTLDIDLRFEPDHDALFRAVPELKEALSINVELASPLDFIPPLPGWEGRSPFIVREGRLDFHHFDFYSQCLAKIERGHAHDLEDVDRMFSSGLVEPQRLLELFTQIEPSLYRYPAIDRASFRARVESAIAGHRDELESRH